MAYTYASIKKMSREFPEKNRKKEEQITAEVEQAYASWQHTYANRLVNAKNNIEGGQ